MDERAISFGSFRLSPSQRLLLEGDQPVRLGSRALDILAVLAENAGRVVPKEELIASVWPKVFVEESNLKIQVSALRRVLGDGQGATATSSRFPVAVTNLSPPSRQSLLPCRCRRSRKPGRTICRLR